MRRAGAGAHQIVVGEQLGCGSPARHETENHFKEYGRDRPEKTDDEEFAKSRQPRTISDEKESRGEDGAAESRVRKEVSDLLAQLRLEHALSEEAVDDSEHEEGQPDLYWLL